MGDIPGRKFRLHPLDLQSDVHRQTTKMIPHNRKRRSQRICPQAATPDHSSSLNSHAFGLIAATKTPGRVSIPRDCSASSMTCRAGAPMSEPIQALWSARMTRGECGTFEDDRMGKVVRSLPTISLAPSIPVRPPPITRTVYKPRAGGTGVTSRPNAPSTTWRFQKYQRRTHMFQDRELAVESNGCREQTQADHRSYSVPPPFCESNASFDDVDARNVGHNLLNSNRI
jgi:hypothetical protein